MELAQVKAHIRAGKAYDERAVVAKVFPLEGAPYYEASIRGYMGRRKRRSDDPGADNH